MSIRGYTVYCMLASYKIWFNEHYAASTEMQFKSVLYLRWAAKATVDVIVLLHKSQKSHSKCRAKVRSVVFFSFPMETPRFELRPDFVGFPISGQFVFLEAFCSRQLRYSAVFNDDGDALTSTDAGGPYGVLPPSSSARNNVGYQKKKQKHLSVHIKAAQPNFTNTSVVDGSLTWARAPGEQWCVLQRHREDVQGQ